MSEPMRCPRCFRTVEPGAKFCTTCGHNFSEEPAAPPRPLERRPEPSDAPRRGSAVWLVVVLILAVLFMVLSLFDSGVVWRQVVSKLEITDEGFLRFLFPGDDTFEAVSTTLWGQMRFGFPAILLAVFPILACIFHYFRKKIPAVIFCVLGLAGPVLGIYTFLRFGVWILLGWSLTAAAVLLFLIGALSRKTAKGCGIAIIIIGVLCMALSFCLSFCGLHYYPASNPDDYEVEVYWNEGDNWDISSETTHRYGVKRTRSTFAVPLFITGRTMDHDAYFSYSTGTACTRFPLSRGLLCIVLGLGCLGGAIWEKKDLVKSGEYPPYPAYKIPTNRSMWKMLLLGFITCGIYPAIISFYMHEDINLIASPHDGRRTMHPFAALMLGYITCGIYYLVWWHKLCNRIGDELDRRRQNYQFSASAFWLWNILGSLILVGPLVFLHKYCTAMNCLADDYNRHG